MVVCLDKGVVAFLDKNSKDDFDVYIIHIIYECFEFFSSHTHWGGFLR